MYPWAVATTAEVREIARMASVSERTVWRMLSSERGETPDADYTTIRVRRADAAVLREIAPDGVSMADVVSALLSGYRE